MKSYRNKAILAQISILLCMVTFGAMFAQHGTGKALFMSIVFFGTAIIYVVLAIEIEWRLYLKRKKQTNEKN